MTECTYSNRLPATILFSIVNDQRASTMFCNDFCYFRNSHCSFKTHFALLTWYSRINERVGDHTRSCGTNKSQLPNLSIVKEIKKIDKKVYF